MIATFSHTFILAGTKINELRPSILLSQGLLAAKGSVHTESMERITFPWAITTICTLPPLQWLDYAYSNNLNVTVTLGY